MALVKSEWSTLHGDGNKSGRWAVWTDDGQPVDLTQKYVRAQARPAVASDTITHTFTVPSGIELGTAWVQLGTGEYVQTSTVRLVLAPVDWVSIPRVATEYVIDIEVASSSSANPSERETPIFVTWSVDLDVTRDDT